MGRRIPAGFAELWYRFRVSDDAEPMYTAIGVELDTPPANYAAWAALLETITDRFQAMCSTEYYLRPSHVLVGAVGDPMRIDYTGAEVFGTRTGTALPNNCAWILRKTTGVGGRANRGRMFVPGVPEADVNNAGVITAAALAAIQTQADGIITDLEASTAVLNVALFHDPATPNPTPPPAIDPDSAAPPTPVLQLVLQPKIGTQRRRMRP